MTTFLTLVSVFAMACSSFAAGVSVGIYLCRR